MKDFSNLQEPGGARLALLPRNVGESLKKAEVVLKKRNVNIQERAARAREARRLKKSRFRDCHKEGVKSAQHFVKRGQLFQQDKKRVTFLKKTPAKQPRMQRHRPLLLIVRNSREGGSVDVRSLLKKLGLRTAFSCTLLRNDAEAMMQLRILRPFVFYGYPTYSTIQRLFLTRARIHSVGEKKGSEELTDNLKVEMALGHLGFLCVEDVTQALWSLSPHFEEIKKHFTSFQLSNLKKVEGLDAKRNQYGDLKEKINEKIWKIA